MDIIKAPVKLEHFRNKEELLFIGFNEIFFNGMVQYNGEFSSFTSRKFDSSFKAYHYLENKIKDQLTIDYPKAILVDLDYLVQDDYRLLHNIRKHADMKYIPFIVISNSKKHKLDTIEAINMGIDDLYYSPINWLDIKKRIQFLAKYKPEMIELIEAPAEELEFKMPLGKRIFDVIFASAVLLAISPILITVAIAIKLSSKGDIFYYSKRAGNGYKVFDFIKFRSMCQDADSKLKHLAHLNQYNADNKDSKAPTFMKLANDPRVTKIGKIIRKTSIDELPQLINVLKGDMSIVGNRPLPLYEAEKLTVDGWSTRFRAPAGLTGLWQISKRGKSDMSVEERIQMDIDYAKDYSIWMDLKIILKTLPAMIQEEAV